MLFNSYAFVFAFLPATLIAFHVARTWLGQRAAMVTLLLASLTFYGLWNLGALALLLASIGGNYLAGRLLERRRSKALLTLFVVLNLCVLGYYKYANFFLETADGLGANFTFVRVILPLGISFFTFEQITFLVDVYRGRTAPGKLPAYGLFVAFFPHLIAGPIVQHRKLAAQFDRPPTPGDAWNNLGLGLSIFAVGLAKKVLIADSFEPTASGLFNAAAHGVHPAADASWLGAFAYAFQIYFDFSGYSDMAIGLARMFGLALPVNFRSPYRAGSIIDFWRRWHISLSTFLRDYVYIPLGGNRHGEGRRYANLMATMLLGGLWHGAAWTFVVWGGLHGLYLVIAQLVRQRLPGPHGKAYRALAWIATFFAVTLAWVFFRADSFTTAWTILTGMAGGYGLTSGTGAGTVALAAAGFLLVWLAPETADLFRLNDDGEPSPADPDRPERAWRRWAPSVPWAVATGLLLLVAILNMTRITEFIYYQF